MKKLLPLLVLPAAALMAGCHNPEAGPSLPNNPSFAEQREKIQNDPSLPPAAKQSELNNIDRIEAQSKK
ncbi:hypothetical protein BH11ARM2_BH11ARM2_31780 [soil metagenome]